MRAAAQRLAPRLLRARPVVGVDRAEPAVGEVLLQPLPGDRPPLRGVLLHRAARLGDPHQLLLGLHQRAVPLLVAAQLVLLPLPLGDVRAEHAHADEPALSSPGREEDQRPVPGLAVLQARADVTVGHRTVLGDHPAHRTGHHRREVRRQELLGQPSEVPVHGQPGEVGEGLVHTLETALDVEDGEGEGGLRRDAPQQGGIRDVHTRLLGRGNGGLRTHGRHLRRVPGSPTRHISITVFLAGLDLPYIIGDGHTRTEVPAAVRSTHPVRSRQIAPAVRRKLTRRTPQDQPTS